MAPDVTHERGSRAVDEDVEREAAETAEAGERYGPRDRLEQRTIALLMAVIEKYGEDGAVEVDCATVDRYASGASGTATYLNESGPTAKLTLVHDPPSALAQTVLEGGADWLEAQSGRAVQVLGAEGSKVIFVLEVAPGRWGEPQRCLADYFLKDHVIAGGVPLLG